MCSQFVAKTAHIAEHWRTIAEPGGRPKPATANGFGHYRTLAEQRATQLEMWCHSLVVGIEVLLRIAGNTVEKNQLPFVHWSGRDWRSSYRPRLPSAACHLLRRFAAGLIHSRWHMDGIAV